MNAKKEGKKMKSVFNTFIIFASLIFASSCSDPNKSTQKEQLSDNQIINIMMTVDKEEIAASQLATKKYSSTAIDNYAKYLILMHQQNLKKLVKLAAQLNLSPTESDISNTMIANGKQNLKSLEDLQGTAFDKAYINAMVAGHQNGLKLIDTTLLLEAQNPKLKTSVKHFRKMVEDHLEKGLKVQKNLKG